MDLPPELVVHVLSFISQSGGSDAVHDLVQCMLVSRSMMQLAQDDQLWQSLLKTRWPPSSVQSGRQSPDHTHDCNKDDRLSAFDQYKKRKLDDDRATELVVQMAKAPCGRLKLMEKIRAELGETVLDRCERDAGPSRRWDLSEPDHWMTIRFWANEAKEGILRDRGVVVWQDIRDRASQDQAEAFERGLLAFGAFRGDEGTTSTVHKLDDLASRLKLSVGPPQQGTAWLEQFALQTVTHLNLAGLVGASSTNFHSLDNHYLDIAFLKARSSQDSQGRGTRGATSGSLPMTLVCIFCSVLRRLSGEYNVEVAPIGFPGIVLAALREKGTEEWTYVNVFVEGGKIMTQGQLRVMLNNMDVPFSPDFLRPSTAREMCIRTAQNILVSVRSGDRGRLVGNQAPTQALHAVATCLFILSPPDRRTAFAQWVVSLTQAEYPSDVGFVEREIVPQRRELGDVELTCKAIREEDENPAANVKHRTDMIEWPIGHVFRHKLFGYIAAITGWDDTCEAGEEWIQAMQVDRLPRGRHQPFYHVTTSDGSTRYVAQENVTNYDDVPEEDQVMLAEIIPLGRHLRCREKDPSGRWGFALSAETKAKYPDS